MLIFNFFMFIKKKKHFKFNIFVLLAQFQSISYNLEKARFLIF